MDKKKAYVTLLTKAILSTCFLFLLYKAESNLVLLMVSAILFLLQNFRGAVVSLTLTGGLFFSIVLARHFHPDNSFIALFPAAKAMTAIWILSLLLSTFIKKDLLLIRKTKLPKALRNIFGRCAGWGWGIGALFIAAAVLFRNINPYYMGFYTLLFFCGAYLLKNYAEPKTQLSTLRKSTINLALLTATLFLCLICLEYAGRTLFQSSLQKESVYLRDEKYGYLLRPDTSTKYEITISPTETISVEHKISSQGIRDYEYPPKGLNEFRILMLGDSFTAGHPVMLEDSIPKVLEKKIRKHACGKQVSVINCGIGGGGPLQELGMLRKRGFALKPDLVLFQVFLGNDLDNALESKGKSLRAYDPKWKKILADWSRQNEFPIRMEVWFYEHSFLYHYLRNILQVHWISWILQNNRFLKNDIPAPLPPSEKRTLDIEANLAHWYPELAEAMDILQKSILTMRKESEAQGADLMIYSIPSVNELDDQRWGKYTANVNDYGGYERWKGERVLREFLESQAIPYIPVREALYVLHDVPNLYYIYDGHLNEHGNEVVAASIVEYILENEYLSPQVNIENKAE